MSLSVKQQQTFHWKEMVSFGANLEINPFLNSAGVRLYIEYKSNEMWRPMEGGSKRVQMLYSEKK